MATSEDSPLLRRFKEKRLPTWMKPTDTNYDTGLLHHVVRNRQRVRMRDTDIVIVAFPHSGTEWLSDTLEQVLPRMADYVQESAPAVLEPFLYHGHPVFWMIPDVNAEAVSAEVYDALEQIPADVPRVFLSQQPFSHFEYLPTRQTRLLYLLRDPHEVWFEHRQFLRQYNALRQTVFEDNYPVEAVNKLGEDDEVMINEFIAGIVPLPPRMNDYGPVFSWPNHVASWVGKQKYATEAISYGRDAMLKSMMKAEMPSHHELNIAIVDFNRAQQDPLSSTIALADFLGADMNATATTAYIAADGTAVGGYSAWFLAQETMTSPATAGKDWLPIDAVAGLKAQAKRSAAASSTGASDDDVVVAAAWETNFAQLPAAVQEYFDLSVLRIHKPLVREGCGGSDCKVPVVNSW